MTTTATNGNAAKPAQPLPPVEWSPPATAAPGLAMAALHKAAANLGEIILRQGEFPAAAGMMCHEADAIAEALIAAGYAQSAVSVIVSHSTSEEDNDDDEHYVAGLEGLDPGEANDARFKAAEDHVRSLARWMGLPEMAATLVTYASRVLRTDAALVELVRAGIPGQLPYVAGILFSRNQEHKHASLSTTGQLFYTDNRPTSDNWFVELHDSQLFETRWGNVGWHAALAVIPNTGEVLFVADNQAGQLERWIASRTQQPL